jgi:hypothetical protein
VKEQTAAYLEKARELLGQAETIFSVCLYEQAGRKAGTATETHPDAETISSLTASLPATW